MYCTAPLLICQTAVLSPGHQPQFLFSSHQRSLHTHTHTTPLLSLTGLWSPLYYWDNAAFSFSHCTLSYHIPQAASKIRKSHCLKEEKREWEGEKVVTRISVFECTFLKNKRSKSQVHTFPILIFLNLEHRIQSNIGVEIISAGYHRRESVLHLHTRSSTAFSKCRRMEASAKATKITGKRKR